MLKDINLQLLAEGDPVVPAAPVVPKTFSEEYVHELREENKLHRQAKKAAEDRIRKLVGLKDDEEIDDAKLTAYQEKQQKTISDALSKANERLLAAEIKGLEGYDSKLVSKLVDRSKITIAEDGTVQGLKEQLTALETEFPVVKKAVNTNPANPAGQNATSPLDEYNAALSEAAKNPRNSELTKKVFLLGEKLRQK